MDVYKREFTHKSTTVRYKMNNEFGDTYMNASGDLPNDLIFKLILEDLLSVPHLHRKHTDRISKRWASIIVGYDIIGGVWPTTKCKEDCIKICDELDRVIDMSKEDRMRYMMELLRVELMEIIMEEF